MERASCKYGIFYTIRRGETLSVIAGRCGISLSELLSMNPYLNPAYYLAGQVIIVPNKKQT